MVCDTAGCKWGLAASSAGELLFDGANPESFEWVSRKAVSVHNQQIVLQLTTMAADTVCVQLMFAPAFCICPCQPPVGAQAPAGSVECHCNPFHALTYTPTTPHPGTQRFISQNARYTSDNDYSSQSLPAHLHNFHGSGYATVTMVDWKIAIVDQLKARDAKIQKLLQRGQEFEPLVAPCQVRDHGQLRLNLTGR